MNVDNKIIEVFELNELSDSAKEENLVYLSNALFKNISINIAEILSDDDLREFNKLLDENEDKALEFLDTKIPDTESLINEEITNMKKLKDELFTK